MKRPVVGIAVLSLLISVGCSQPNSSADKSERNKKSTVSTADGQKAAEHIRDLLVAKCGDQYYFTSAIGSMGQPVRDIAASYHPLEVDGQEKFYGIEARGRAHVVGTMFELVKKDGDWYLRTGGAEGDVKVDSLRPAAPECPASNS